MPAAPAPPGPRSPQVFQILLSLSDGPLHGYAVIQDIRERRGGEVRLKRPVRMARDKRLAPGRSRR